MLFGLWGVVTRIPAYTVDELQAHLFSCINLLIPNLKQIATASEQANYYSAMSELTDKYLANFILTLKSNISDPKTLQLLLGGAGTDRNTPRLLDDKKTDEAKKSDESKPTFPQGSAAPQLFKPPTTVNLSPILLKPDNIYKLNH